MGNQIKGLLKGSKMRAKSDLLDKPVIRRRNSLSFLWGWENKKNSSRYILAILFSTDKAKVPNAKYLLDKNMNYYTIIYTCITYIYIYRYIWKFVYHDCCKVNYYHSLQIHSLQLISLIILTFITECDTI